MSKKVGILVGLVVISLLFLQSGSTLTPATNIPENDSVFQVAQASWLENWTYRKSHVITGGSDAGENFQMNFIVYYGTGFDEGNKVYSNYHCRSDFGDLRFTSSDGVTEYDYWIQNVTIGVQALFWVEITESLNITRTMYIYYGQSSATTTSNGNATFRYFEEFSRPDSETVGNGWTEDENQTSVSITNEALNISGPQHQYAHAELPISEGVNLVLEGNIYAPSNEIGREATAICLYWDDHVWLRAGWRSAKRAMDPEPLFFIQENGGTGVSGGGVGIPWENGSRWYRFRIILGYTTLSQYSLDNGYTWDTIPHPVVRPTEYAGAPTRIILGRGYSDSPTGNYPNPDLDNVLLPETFPNATAFIDDVFVRGYSVYVPLHDEYGAEELSPAVDASPPAISHPDDVTFAEGSTGYKISWTLTDENPNNYTVWKQEELYDYGNWDTSPKEVTVSLDGITEGAYIFSMVAWDTYNNLNFDQVIVTVTPPTTTFTSTPTTTNGTQGTPPDMLTIGIAVGSGLGIIVVVVLILRRGKQG